jgi:hypothetical protein
MSYYSEMNFTAFLCRNSKNAANFKLKILTLFFAMKIEQFLFSLAAVK